MSLEHTLARDASRQYIDVNFSIGESRTGKVRNMHENSTILPRNASLSKVSDSIGHYSDVNAYASRIRTITGRASEQRQPVVSLSAALQKSKKKNLSNWKAQRRASEQTRMNDITELYE